MQFPSGTTAIGLATSARTFRESATKKPLTGGKLRDAGTEIALGGGELGAAVQRVIHDLYIVYIKKKKKRQGQKKNGNFYYKSFIRNTCLISLFLSGVPRNGA